MNATSQAYRDGTNLPKTFSSEEKNNDIVDNNENHSELGK